MNVVKIEKLRQKYFRSLPNRLSCAHCGKKLPKERFGVRLMNGPAVETEKVDPVFRAQPRCVKCRG